MLKVSSKPQNSSTSHCFHPKATEWHFIFRLLARLQSTHPKGRQPSCTLSFTWVSLNSHQLSPWGWVEGYLEKKHKLVNIKGSSQLFSRHTPVAVTKLLEMTMHTLLSFLVLATTLLMYSSSLRFIHQGNTNWGLCSQFISSDKAMDKKRMKGWIPSFVSPVSMWKCLHLKIAQKHHTEEEFYLNLVLHYSFLHWQRRPLLLHRSLLEKKEFSPAPFPSFPSYVNS